MQNWGEEQLWEKNQVFLFLSVLTSRYLLLDSQLRSQNSNWVYVSGVPLREARSVSTHLGLSIREQVLFQTPGLYKIIRKL